MRGKIPVLTQLEIGVDASRVDYSCDVVLYWELDSQAALDAYAIHPEYVRVKDELTDLRIARHQVDYDYPQEDAAGHPKPSKGPKPMCDPMNKQL